MAKLGAKHIKEAESRRFEDPSGIFEGQSKDEVIQAAWEMIGRYNYKVVHRARSTTSMTLAFRLYLGNGFDQRGKTDQAGLLWHEICHMRQWRRLGAVFALRYLDARWRWAYEIHGYRQQFRIYHALGVSEEKIMENVDRLQGSFRGPTYRMGRVDASQMKMETKRVILSGLPELGGA